MVKNAYVGPRPFRRGERIYGREREIRKLFYLLGAERIVLLHSPSGAGKTSLIEAGLIPWLKRERFYVWPTIRLGLETQENSPNRYTASAHVSLEEGLPPDKRRSLASLAQLSLSEYIAGRPRPSRASPRIVLIFDQFEEVLTVDPLAVEAKKEFFGQLGEALKDPQIWALVAIREDYLAPLDPYLDHVPTRLGNRFRLDLLGLEPAEQAIIQPAENAGRQFDVEAAQKLVQDLATVRVQQADGSFLDQTGRYVEPVQLQVVCHRLWDQLAEKDLSIGMEHVESSGDVDQALSDYYNDKVDKLCAGDLKRQRSVREWFSEKLITPGGIRNQVLMGEGKSGGLDNALIERLRNIHLVRREKRAGATWFELAHDRLVDPVQNSNEKWFQRHLEPFQRRSANWEKEGRPEGLLLRGPDLQEAERYRASQPEMLLPVEEELIELSQRRRRAERSRKLLFATAFAVAILVAAGAYFLMQRAERQATIARSRLLISHSASQPPNSFDLPILLAFEAYRLQPDAQSRSNLIRQLRHPSEELMLTLRGHSDVVARVAWSPDGEMLASVSYDETVRFWRFPSGEHVETGDNSCLRPRNPSQPPGIVTRLEWSRDGNWLASGGLDNPVCLWDLSGGGDARPTSRILGAPDTSVNSLAWNPESGQLAVASSDGTVQLWEPETDELRTLYSHDGVLLLAWSRDGKTLASGDQSGTIKLWSASAKQPLTASLQDLLAVTSLAWQEYKAPVSVLNQRQTFSILACANESGQVFVLQEASGDEAGHGWQGSDSAARKEWMVQGPEGLDAWVVRQLERGHGTGPAMVAWAAPRGSSFQDIRLLSVGFDGRVLSHQLFPESRQTPRTSEWIAGSEPGSTRSISWDIRMGLAKGAEGGVVQVLSERDPEFVWTGQSAGRGPEADSEEAVDMAQLRGHEDEVASVAWSPRNGFLASSSSDGTIKIWHPANLYRGNRAFRTLPDQVAGTTAAFDPSSSQQISLTHAGGQGFRFLDWQTGQLLDDRSLEDFRVWHLGTLQDEEEIDPFSARLTALSWQSGLQRLSLGVSVQAGPPESPRTVGEVIVWDGESNSFKKLARHEDDVTALSWNPTGSMLASSSYDQTIRISDLETENAVIHGKHADEVTALEWSPDGGSLASASGAEGTICISQVEAALETQHDISCSGHLGADGIGHKGPVAALAWNPDGTILASGGLDDHQVILWERSGQVRSILSGHTGELTHLAWGPDGERLASASKDRSVRIWKGGTGELVLALEQAHGDSVTWVDWDPQGTRLVTSGLDGAVRIWNLDESVWIEHARRIVNRNLSEEDWRSIMGDVVPLGKTFPEPETP